MKTFLRMVIYTFVFFCSLQTFAQTTTEDGGSITFGTGISYSSTNVSNASTTQNIVIAKNTSTSSLYIGNKLLAFCAASSVSWSDYRYISSVGNPDFFNQTVGYGDIHLGVVPYSDTTRYYMRVPYNNYNCMHLTSNKLKVTVEPIIGKRILCSSDLCSETDSVILGYFTSYTLLSTNTTNINETKPLGDSAQYFGEYSAAPPFVFTWEKKIGNTWQTLSNLKPMGYGATYEAVFIKGSGVYRRKVTDALGRFAYSNELTIQVLKYDVSLNTYNQQLALGQAPTTLSVSRTVHSGFFANNASDYVYQWQKTTDTTSNTWTNISGATSTTYTPAINENAFYRCGVMAKTQSYGGGCVYKYTYASEIKYQTNSILPGSISFNSGFVSFSSGAGTIKNSQDASGGVGTLNYNWYKKDTGNTWVLLPGIKTAFYNFTGLKLATYFQRAAVDANGDKAFSNIVLVNIQYQTLKGGIINPSTKNICSGSMIYITNSLLPCGGVGSYTCSWEYKDSTGIWQTIPNKTDLASLNFANVTQQISVRRKVVDTKGNIAYSNEVFINVYKEVLAGTVYPETQQICSNSIDGKAASLSPDITTHYMPQSNIIYQWESSNNATTGFTTISGATQRTYTPIKVTQTTYYRLKVISGTCSFINYTNVVAVEVVKCGTTTGKIL